MIEHSKTSVHWRPQSVCKNDLPVLLSKELEASVEGPEERIVVLSGNTWIPIPVVLIVHLASIDLHANEWEDEEHKKHKHEQVDQWVEGIHQGIQYDGHLLHGPQQPRDSQHSERPKYSDWPECRQSSSCSTVEGEFNKRKDNHSAIHIVEFVFQVLHNAQTQDL